VSGAGPGARSHSPLGAELDRLVGTLAGGGNLFGLLILLVALFAAFSFILPGSFPRPSTLQAMMFQLPELGLLSLAMVIPLISGGLNLAIIATSNQSALLMAWILTAQMPPDAAGASLWLWLGGALLAGFLLCLLIGIVTGFIVAVLNVHPILATLGTQTLIGGINIWLSRGRTISGFPAPLLAIANDTLLGVPISFVLFIVVAAAAHLLLTRRPLGLRIHMAGSNLAATRYSGVDTRRVLVGVYVLSSLLCWLAAIVMMGRFNSAGADIAQSYLLITVLAAILGGIDPYGGFGRVHGLLLSLAILQTISSGFNLLGLSEHLTLALWGFTLLFVMAVKRFAGFWRGRALTKAGTKAHVTPSNDPNRENQR
jgi:simple sugar transport system permease protein